MWKLPRSGTTPAFRCSPRSKAIAPRPETPARTMAVHSRIVSTRFIAPRAAESRFASAELAHRTQPGGWRQPTVNVCVKPGQKCLVSLTRQKELGRCGENQKHPSYRLGGRFRVRGRCAGNWCCRLGCKCGSRRRARRRWCLKIVGGPFRWCGRRGLAL
jgi:hypothetical protein